MVVDIHKNERQFHVLNLSEVNVVKWLILFRDQIDLYYESKVNVYYDKAGDVNEVNQEIITLYADLDNLIEKCNFDKKRALLIDLLHKGYNFDDVASLYFNDTAQNVEKMFENICHRIVEMNNRQWKIWAHKKYSKTELKKCSRCNEYLPQTESFFSPDSRMRSGFHSYCKECR